MKETKYRRQLNPHQIAILNTLYKFRFTTASILKDNQQANNLRVVSSRLKILVDQGYIAMNYDSSYRIKGKPATYYLTTKGVRFLRSQSYTQESALRSIYHDKRTEEHIIQHRLNVFSAYVGIKHNYPDRFKFFSKTEIMNRDYLPRIKPDAYIVDNRSDKTYFLDCLEESLSFWELRKAVKRYIAYAEMDTWQEYKDIPHPEIILVCDSDKLQKRVKRMVEKELDSSYIELGFITTRTVEGNLA